MFAQKLAPTGETSYLVSRLFYEKHIYKTVDDRLHDVWYAHNTLKDIESGKVLVFGVFKKEDEFFCGCATGEISGMNIIVHALFKRNVDVEKAALLIEKEILKYSIDSGVEIKSIIGTIPEYNRAALMMSKRAGYVDVGIAEDVLHFKNGKVIPCRYMKKEI